jgi:hypothetical protein
VSLVSTPLPEPAEFRPLNRRDARLVVALFVVLSCVMVYPLSAFWAPRLPLSDDAMFSVWRLAWVAHRLRTQPTDLFDANIFYPAGNTLAYSDAMIALGLAAAPLQWVGLHPVLVHNLLLVMAFFLSAYGAFALSRHLTGNTAASVIAGVVFAFAPYRFAHIGHLELLWTAPMPAAVLLTLRLFDHPAITRAVLLGLCIALQGLVGIYYCVFLCLFVLLLVAFVWIVTRPRMTRGHFHAACAAVLVAATTLAPYAWIYRESSAHLGHREPDEIRRYSALPSDYLQVASPNHLYHREPREAEDELSLFPGVTAILLSVLGLITATKRTFRYGVIFGGLAVLMFDLSLGLNGLLYPLLLDLAPPLRGLRAPARFGALFLLCIAVLSACGFDGAFGKSRVRAAAFVLAVSLCLTEYFSAPLETREVPLQPLRAHQWLAGQPPGPILELPVPQPGTLWLFEPTYQYLSIYHWRPLLNGYSAYAPEHYVRNLELLREFPFGRTETLLRQSGVRYVLLHERLSGQKRFAEWLAVVPQVKIFGPPRLFTDASYAVAVVPVLP